jgi:hypothetical protein
MGASFLGQRCSRRQGRLRSDNDRKYQYHSIEEEKPHHTDDEPHTTLRAVNKNFHATISALRGIDLHIGVAEAPLINTEKIPCYGQ